MNVQITCWECDHDHAHDIPDSKAGLEVETKCPQCNAMNIVEFQLEDIEAPKISPCCTCLPLFTHLEKELEKVRRHSAELKAMLPKVDQRRVVPC